MSSTPDENEITTCAECEAEFDGDPWIGDSGKPYCSEDCMIEADDAPDEDDEPDEDDREGNDEEGDDED
jgi:NMD protein affecting ribosome stability and mRNA decay